MMNEMNYRYNNPNVNVTVDQKLAVAFASKERTKEQIERFGLWASMSKEAKAMGPILQNVAVLENERVKQVI